MTIAGDRSAGLERTGSAPLDALAGGFHLAFLVAAGLLLLAGLVAPLLGRVEVSDAPPGPSAAPVEEPERRRRRAT